MKLLIAEDEVSIANALKVMLTKNKYIVDVVYNGKDALDYITQFSYDALILDIMMPEMDGLTVLKKARQKGIRTPALFLTAKSDINDRVIGLDAGADDYLAKPFASKEFLARVRALTRRYEAYSSNKITLGNTTLDCNQYTLTAKQNSTRLNNKEFQLMELFLRHPHQVFSTERLMDNVWEQDSVSELDVVWTYIGFLRKKLRLIDSDIEIKTIRGAGYLLEEKIC
ncbi:MAG: response regulator transcription factor [Lachnospiraceae bacterium]